MQTLENNELILFYAYTLLDNLTETRDRREIFNFIERKRKEFEREKFFSACAITTDHGEEIGIGISNLQEQEEKET